MRKRRKLHVLCGYRPIEEQTRYKEDDEDGRAVARKIEHGEYSPQRAIDAWAPPASDEEVHVPSLVDARREVHRLGV